MDVLIASGIASALIAVANKLAEKDIDLHWKADWSHLKNG